VSFLTSLILTLSFKSELFILRFTFDVRSLANNINICIRTHVLILLQLGRVSWMVLFFVFFLVLTTWFTELYFFALAFEALVPRGTVVLFWGFNFEWCLWHWAFGTRFAVNVPLRNSTPTIHLKSIITIALLSTLLTLILIFLLRLIRQLMQSILHLPITIVNDLIKLINNLYESVSF
jgi:hypothetical protein